MADTGTVFGGLSGGLGGAGRALERVMSMREAIAARKAEEEYRKAALGAQTQHNLAMEELEGQKLDLSRQLAEDQRVDQMVQSVVEGFADMQVIVDPAGIRDRIRNRMRAEAMQAAAPPVENLQRDIGGALQRGADVARTTTDQQDYSSRLRGAATTARQTIGDQPGQTAPVTLDGQTVGTAYTKPSTSQRIFSNRAESERVKLLTALMTTLSREEIGRVGQYYATLRSVMDNLTQDRWGMMSPEEKAQQATVAKRALDQATGGLGIPNRALDELRVMVAGELGYDLIGELGLRGTGGTARPSTANPQNEGAETRRGGRRSTRDFIRNRTRNE